MSNSKSNKSDAKYEIAHDNVEVSCFNCGNTVTMSVLKAESMEQMGQEVYCYECNEEVDESGDFSFVPFF